MTTKILVFSSNPQDTEQLQLNREFRQIKEARNDSQNKRKFDVVPVRATTIDDLQREISEEKAKIVHFCGHGIGDLGLVLETKLGQQDPISNQAIGGLFKLFANQVECVVLNACFSQSQAAAIEQHINYVIGTKKAIRDDAAIAFSRGFYTALFSGKSIQLAYEFGKNRIQQEIYNPNHQGRKLVTVDLEQGELPEEEVFAFYIKNPLNQIEVEPEPQPQQDIKIKVERGNYNERIGRDYIHVEGNLIQNPESTKNPNKPSNLKKTGAVNFVGRKEKLAELHQLLQQNERVTISAIAGMGGIGKTELALQYALAYQDDYPGSLCWFSVRGENLGTQIIEFAGTYLNLFVPEELKSDVAKVDYCWQNWRDERSLIVLDDVANYGQFYQENIVPYLPPATNNIKVLMTSRERPGKNIPSIDLDVLSEAAALELLAALAGGKRIVCDLQTKKDYPSEFSSRTSICSFIQVCNLRL
ncbi:MAG: NB-ARC domain-containing protein [Pleurocapsa sp. MO_226.B13]|nr:NB-ARC domain-containing protein [Pleurocapsa sp. MO_226.B13]